MKTRPLLRRRRYPLILLAAFLAGTLAGLSSAAPSQTRVKRGLGPVKFQPKGTRDAGGKGITVGGSFFCSGAGSRITIQVSGIQAATGAFGVGRFPDVVGLDPHSPGFRARALKSLCRGRRVSWHAKVQLPKTAAATVPSFKSGEAKLCAVAYQIVRNRFAAMNTSCRLIRLS